MNSDDPGFSHGPENVAGKIREVAGTVTAVTMAATSATLLVGILHILTSWW